MQRLMNIATRDGKCDSYACCPDAPGPYPAVLLLMDGIGVRAVLKRRAEQIAAAGYYVLLPNLFYRDGPAAVANIAEPLKPENRPALMDRIHSVTPQRVREDVDHFLSFLDQEPLVAPGGIGVVGYCMGGSHTVRTAADYPDRVLAAAVFHGGRLATDAPDSPHRLLATIRAELYFGHADEDPNMTGAQIALLEAALGAARLRFGSEIYSGARHGYTMEDLPAFNAHACERHFGQLYGLLSRALVKP